MLREVKPKYGNQWDRALPVVLFALRSIPNETTGFSPLELLYGHRVRGPLDLLLDTWQGTKTRSKDVITYVNELRDGLITVQKEARANEEKNKAIMKRWYDRNTRLRTFNPGDMVTVLNPSTSINGAKSPSAIN